MSQCVRREVRRSCDGKIRLTEWCGRLVGCPAPIESKGPAGLPAGSKTYGTIRTSSTMSVRGELW